MTIKEIKDLVANTSSEVETTRVNLILKLAIMEVWLASDIPGMLKKVYLQLGDNAQASFPFDVFAIRGARPVNHINNIQIRQPYAAFTDELNAFGSYTWELVEVSPVHTPIRNAGKLTFTSAVADTNDVTISISGETPHASRASETVTLEAGGLTAESSSVYRRLISLHRTKGEFDVSVSVQSIEVARLPNFAHESRYPVIKVFQLCNGQVGGCCGSGCVEVLYQEHPPSEENDSEVVQPPFDTVVLHKAMETQKRLEDMDVGALAAKARDFLVGSLRNQLAPFRRQPNYRTSGYWQTGGDYSML